RARISSAVRGTPELTRQCATRSRVPDTRPTTVSVFPTSTTSCTCLSRLGPWGRPGLVPAARLSDRSAQRVTSRRGAHPSCADRHTDTVGALHEECAVLRDPPGDTTPVLRGVHRPPLECVPGGQRVALLVSEGRAGHRH